MADQNSQERFAETPGGQSLASERALGGQVDGDQGGSDTTREPSDAQHDEMQAEPYLAYDLNRDGGAQAGRGRSATSQMSRHGEGAESTGNSTRGMLSAGLTGATTTRGGQQGGIGASAFDAEPGARRREEPGESEPRDQEDLTLGEQFGGTMAPPDGPVHTA